MKTKKQLDRLFREQFKNFEVSPPPVVWENISNALHKKKKNRRIVPIWYKIAGVAALLLVFFSIGNYLYDSSPSTLITNQEKENKSIPSGLEENNTVVNEDNNTTIDASEIKNQKASKEEELVTTSSEGIKLDHRQDVQKQKANIVNKTKSSDIAVSSEKVKTEKANSETSIVENQKTEKELAENISKENKTKTDFKKESEISESKVAIVEPSEENKKSIFDAIEEKAKEDALAVRQKEALENRWDVSPNFAPIYYNTLGNGSSIDTRFSENSKSGDVNFSYGVKVSYALNNKLSIRTGINKVDLSYVTNDIEFAAATGEASIKSIDYERSNIIVAVGNRGTLQPPPSGTPTMIDGFVIVPRNGVIPGTMSQQMDYFEVPLELKYSLLNSRFGLNMIGGMSTLILSGNEINVNSDGFTTKIGEANNLNTLSFSTNIGLGFDYKLTKRFIFNLEPMFKYQINPYSDTSIDFKPYYLGVYTGFSYRF
jgi:cytoskeletal protein RodZ